MASIVFFEIPDNKLSGKPQAFGSSKKIKISNDVLNRFDYIFKGDPKPVETSSLDQNIAFMTEDVDNFFKGLDKESPEQAPETKDKVRIAIYSGYLKLEGDCLVIDQGKQVSYNDSLRKFSDQNDPTFSQNALDYFLEKFKEYHSLKYRKDEIKHIKIYFSELDNDQRKFLLEEFSESAENSLLSKFLENETLGKANIPEVLKCIYSFSVYCKNNKQYEKEWSLFKENIERIDFSNTKNGFEHHFELLQSKAINYLPYELCIQVTKRKVEEKITAELFTKVPEYYNKQIPKPSFGLLGHRDQNDLNYLPLSVIRYLLTGIEKFLSSDNSILKKALDRTIYYLAPPKDNNFSYAYKTNEEQGNDLRRLLDALLINGRGRKEPWNNDLFKKRVYPKLFENYEELFLNRKRDLKEYLIASARLTNGVPLETSNIARLYAIDSEFKKISNSNSNSNPILLAAMLCLYNKDQDPLEHLRSCSEFIDKLNKNEMLKRRIDEAPLFPEIFFELLPFFQMRPEDLKNPQPEEALQSEEAPQSGEASQPEEDTIINLIERFNIYRLENPEEVDSVKINIHSFYYPNLPKFYSFIKKTTQRNELLSELSIQYNERDSKGNFKKITKNNPNVIKNYRNPKDFIDYLRLINEFTQRLFELESNRDDYYQLIGKLSMSSQPTENSDLPSGMPFFMFSVLITLYKEKKSRQSEEGPFNVEEEFNSYFDEYQKKINMPEIFIDNKELLCGLIQSFLSEQDNKNSVLSVLDRFEFPDLMIDYRADKFLDNFKKNLSNAINSNKKLNLDNESQKDDLRNSVLQIFTKIDREMHEDVGHKMLSIISEIEHQHISNVKNLIGLLSSENDGQNIKQFLGTIKSIKDIETADKFYKREKERNFDIKIANLLPVLKSRESLSSLNCQPRTLSLLNEIVYYHQDQVITVSQDTQPGRTEETSPEPDKDSPVGVPPDENRGRSVAVRVAVGAAGRAVGGVVRAVKAVGRAAGGLANLVRTERKNKPSDGAPSTSVQSETEKLKNIANFFEKNFSLSNSFSDFMNNLCSGKNIRYERYKQVSASMVSVFEIDKRLNESDSENESVRQDLINVLRKLLNEDTRGKSDSDIYKYFDFTMGFIDKLKTVVNENKLEDIKCYLKFVNQFERDKSIDIDTEWAKAFLNFPYILPKLDSGQTKKSLIEHFDYLKKDFKSIEDVGNDNDRNAINQERLKEALGKLQINDPEDKAEKFWNIRKNLLSKNYDDFKTYAEKTPKEFRELDDIELISFVAQSLFLTKGERLNTTQYATILNILENENPNEAFKKLIEIRTGEGKTRISAVCMACLALKGSSVDFLTTDNLVSRDYFDYKVFYQSLNIRTSLIKNDSPKEDYLTKSQEEQYGVINYSDPAALCVNSLRHGTESQEKQAILFLDEADQALIDNASKPVTLARPDQKFNPDDYKLVWDFFQNPKNEISYKKFNNLGKPLSTNANYDNNKAYFTHLIKAARKANGLEKGKDFNLVKIKDNNGSDEVVAIPIPPPATYFEDGIQQMLHIRLEQERLRLEQDRQASEHGSPITNDDEFKNRDDLVFFPLKAPPESKRTVLLSNFFRRYPNILGVTGTLGSKKDENYLRKIYGIKTFNRVSKHLQGELRTGVQILTGKDKWRKTIVEKCSTITGPIVLYVENDKEMKSFQKKLQEDLPDADKKEVIIKGQLPKNFKMENNQIYITTKDEARGIDFNKDEARKINFTVDDTLTLTVISTCPNQHTRDSLQMKGRTNRQGKGGDFIGIFHDEQISNILKIPYLLFKLYKKFKSDEKLVSRAHAIKDKEIQKETRVLATKTSILSKIFSAISNFAKFVKEVFTNPKTDTAAGGSAATPTPPATPPPATPPPATPPPATPPPDTPPPDTPPPDTTNSATPTITPSTRQRQGPP